MATTPTGTEAPTLTLTPPEPVPVVPAEKAVGLVPVAAEAKSKLEEKVDAFVADLIASDANSPEFGKKVDQITNMGRKEIMAAAGMSNRFLHGSSPVFTMIICSKFFGAFFPAGINTDNFISASVSL